MSVKLALFSVLLLLARVSTQYYGNVAQNGNHFSNTPPGYTNNNNYGSSSGSGMNYGANTAGLYNNIMSNINSNMGGSGLNYGNYGNTPSGYTNNNNYGSGTGQNYGNVGSASGLYNNIMSSIDNNLGSTNLGYSYGNTQPYGAAPVYGNSQPVYGSAPVYGNSQPVYGSAPVYGSTPSGSSYGYSNSTPAANTTTCCNTTGNFMFISDSGNVTTAPAVIVHVCDEVYVVLHTSSAAFIWVLNSTLSELKLTSTLNDVAPTNAGLAGFSPIFVFHFIATKAGTQTLTFEEVPFLSTSTVESTFSTEVVVEL